MQDFFWHLKKQKREEPVDKWNMTCGGAEAREREGNTWTLVAFSNTRNTCSSNMKYFIFSEETPSTDLQHSFSIRTDWGYKQHFKRCHCQPWLALTCKLWADIPHIIYSPPNPMQQTTAALPDIHRYTLCFTYLWWEEQGNVTTGEIT